MECQWTSVITAFTSTATLVAVTIAVLTYRRNAQIERAKWTLILYEKFYEKPDLKRVREILDSEPDNEEVTQMVANCPGAEFPDYLNFFEYVAFLIRKKHLNIEDVKAHFDYYIRCLKRHPSVLGFIKESGFEGLDKLLKDWK